MVKYYKDSFTYRELGKSPNKKLLQKPKPKKTVHRHKNYGKYIAGATVLAVGAAFLATSGQQSLSEMMQERKNARWIQYERNKRLFSR
jgi:hypothetical protein